MSATEGVIYLLPAATVLIASSSSSGGAPFVRYAEAPSQRPAIRVLRF